MSISSVGIIMGRIASATKESPIAVFDIYRKLDYGVRVRALDAFFASTVLSKNMIKNDSRLIGVYDKTMERSFIVNKLSYFANRR